MSTFLMGWLSTSCSGLKCRQVVLVAITTVPPPCNDGRQSVRGLGVLGDGTFSCVFETARGEQAS